MDDHAATALLERAERAERLGDARATSEILDTLYDAALALRRPDLLSEAVVRQAYAARRAGSVDAALELFELACELGTLHGDRTILGRALNGTGMLHQQAGNLVAAEHAFMEAHRHAAASGSDRYLGETEQNLGVIHHIRGERTAAYEHYAAALVHLQRAGHDRACAVTLNNLGMLAIEGGDLDTAEGHFGRALEACDRIGDIPTACAIHINLVELYLARGDTARARSSCDEGFEIASRLGDEVRRAEALKYYGIIYREAGMLHLADIHLTQAADIASARDPLLEAEVHRERSLVMRAMGRNREALEALNRSHVLFTSIEARSKQADIAQRIDALEQDFLSLVRVWSESIEAKDLYTSGHCVRVADYACRLAERAGMDGWEMVWFRMGAFLHDLGKTEVPGEILNKPGRLDDEERRLIERHTVIGEEMLASVEFPWDIRPMVRWHHERWDGTGYPDGLAGEDIHLSARILRIADVFDALTTARSYRRPLTPEEALAIMREDEGSFDPALFATFLELYPDFAEIARRAASTA